MVEGIKHRESQVDFGAKAVPTLHTQRFLRRLDKTIGELSATDIIHSQMIGQVGRLIPPTYKPIKHLAGPIGAEIQKDLILRRNASIQADLLLRELMVSDMIVKTSMIYEDGVSSIKTYADAADALCVGVRQLHQENISAKERVAKKQAQLEKLQSESIKARYARGYWSSILQSVRRPLCSNSFS